ncbi:hypothetical protein ACFVVM_17520 [Nocardia sp. NPDC058176]|uniref:hypothetical protein n=1 Tax=Nocardia sp. NPDC058176 TaxID=3346368 RepID=UPI0036D9BA09
MRRTTDRTTLVLLASLVLFAGATAATAIRLELSDRTCPLDYGGCYTPYMTLGSQVACAGAAAAVLGSAVWVAIGTARARSVRYVPVLGAVLVIATFLAGREIATWS